MDDLVVKTRIAEMEAKMETLKKAKDDFEENLELKKKDAYDHNTAKYNKFMKETFGTTNPPPPYPFYQPYPLNPHPNPPDPAEPEMDVEEEDEYTASVKASQEKHLKVEDTESCDVLKVAKINEKIKSKMQCPGEIKDQRMKWLCQSALKAIWPLATASSELSHLQFFLQQN